jgi:Mlc titration factor MtfA (ptsG expression regulator)
LVPLVSGRRAAVVLTQIIVFAVVFVLLAGGFVVVGPLLRRLALRAAARHEAAPIPPQWLPLLERSVPAIANLTTAERERLLHASRELVDTLHWEGCGGLELTPDMRLIIAAQASLLILAIPGEPFPGLRQVLVYPHTFVPRRVCDPRKWRAASECDRPQPELGETWGDGTLVLAWDAAILDASKVGSEQNVVLHEFAHELAFENRLTPPSPLAPWEPNVPQPDAWRDELKASFERLVAKLDSKTPTVLWEYAATNLAEFFAVATEAFFGRPTEVRQEYSALYEQLRNFYRQDPASRMDRLVERPSALAPGSTRPT